MPLWIVGSFSLQAYGSWTTRLVSVEESTNLLYALLTQIYIVSYGSHCKSHRLSFRVSNFNDKDYKSSKSGFCSSFNDCIVPPLPTPLTMSWLLRMKGQCMSTLSIIIITHAFWVSMPCHIALKYRSPINIVFSWKCILFYTTIDAEGLSTHLPPWFFFSWCNVCC